MISVQLTNYTKNPVKAIEDAASNCYDAKNKRQGDILNECINANHLAVTEFADFTFHVEGVSRSLLAQLTRHRVASYMVRSQRYCDEDGFSYVTPPSINNDKENKQVFMEAMANIRNAYKTLCEYGVPKEDARYVLPNACFTIVEIKMNFRELMHFCNERLCRKAQWEIRELAKMMKRCVMDVAPELGCRLTPKCEKYAPYCFCVERRPCGKYPTLRKLTEARDEKH